MKDFLAWLLFSILVLEIILAAAVSFLLSGIYMGILSGYGKAEDFMAKFIAKRNRRA